MGEILNHFDIEKLKESFKRSIIIVGILFAVCSFDWFLEKTTNGYFSLKEFFSIEPRKFQGVFGIPFSFFLHANLNHLLNNTLILLAGVTILFSFYERAVYSILFMIIAISQLFIWIFGSEGAHIGASGVGFGVVTFIASMAIFIRTEKQLIVSFFVIFFFGGAVSAGMMPEIRLDGEQTNIIKNNISYAGHWGGVVAGLFTSYYHYKKGKL